jgi:hypothetical protein
VVDLNELKKLALAAVAGPWVAWSYEGPTKHGGESHSVCRHVGGRMSEDHTCVATAIGETEDHARANAAYIAAVNPAAVLELIERQTKMLVAMRNVREMLCDGGCRHVAREKIADALSMALGDGPLP